MEENEYSSISVLTFTSLCAKNEDPLSIPVSPDCSEVRLSRGSDSDSLYDSL